MKASRLWCSRIRDESLSILLPEYKKRHEDAIAAATTSAAPSAASQADPFTGTWTGIVRTESGDIPLTLNAQASGDIHAKLGSQLETRLNRARFGNGRLSGIMTGDLGVGATAFNLYLFMRD